MNGLIQLLQQIIPSKTYNVAPAAGTGGTQNSAIPNVHQYGKTPQAPAGGMVPGQFYTGWSPKPKGPINPKSADFDYLGDWKPPFPVHSVSQRSLMDKAQ